ncbi:hypothetical protein CR513_16020, partial [Mucuna pruriens]
MDRFRAPPKLNKEASWPMCLDHEGLELCNKIFSLRILLERRGEVTDDTSESFIVVIDAIKTPTLVQEGLKDENWVQAMKEEMKALEKNSTWAIVDKPKDQRAIDCRWIYTETFAPNSKDENSKSYSFLSCSLWLEFCNSLIAHFAFTEEGIGIAVSQQVCRLKKALYGLNSLPKHDLEDLLKHSHGDHTLFIKSSPKGKLTLLLVYVDDMIVTGMMRFKTNSEREKLTTL